MRERIIAKAKTLQQPNSYDISSRVVSFASLPELVQFVILLERDGINVLDLERPYVSSTQRFCLLLPST